MNYATIIQDFHALNAVFEYLEPGINNSENFILYNYQKSKMILQLLEDQES